MTPELFQTTRDEISSTAMSSVQPLNIAALFGRDVPLDVDLGSGHGTFLLEMAAKFPERNFIGTEKCGRRVRKTIRFAEERELANLRMLQIESEFAVRKLMPAWSVDVFHIAFPDPWPKRRHWPRRLINDAFLDAVYRALRVGGELRIQTDHTGYGEWIEKIIVRRADFTRLDWPDNADFPRTDFEKRFTGQQLYRTRLRKV